MDDGRTKEGELTEDCRIIKWQGGKIWEHDDGCSGDDVSEPDDGDIMPPLTEASPVPSFVRTPSKYLSCQ